MSQQIFLMSTEELTIIGASIVGAVGTVRYMGPDYVSTETGMVLASAFLPPGVNLAIVLGAWYVGFDWKAVAAGTVVGLGILIAGNLMIVGKMKQNK